MVQWSIEAVPGEAAEELWEVPQSQQGLNLGGSRLKVARSWSAREPRDGVEAPVEAVLVTWRERDEATRRCDAFFDTATTEECAFALPPIPPGMFRDPAETVPGGIGLIQGPSGSAKSVLLRYHCGMPTEVEWDPALPALAHFEPSTLSERLAAVAVEPQWLGSRRYQELSQGEPTPST